MPGLGWLQSAVAAVCFTAFPLSSATWAAEAHFVFQSSTAEKGVVAIAAQMPFRQALGYGFEPRGAIVDTSANCSQPASPTVDPVTEPDIATRFSVVLPEGRYRVTMHFRKAPTGAIMAETRRFYLLPAAPGQLSRRMLSFVVDVRSAALPALPLNAPGATAVRLNPRECGSYSWDNKLTFAFSRDAQNLSRLDIAPAETHRLFLIGDSTVTDQPQPPYAGWGQMLPLFFGDSMVISNQAESGETLKSYLAELRLDKVLSLAQPGDWALIQFSHNDEKSQWPQTYAPADSTFPLYLKLYIAELRRKGVQPILVTPMQRLRFDANGKIIETHGGYPTAIRAVATSENVPVIDLTTLSTTLFERLGPTKARVAFAGNGADTTHQSAYGAFELARTIVEAIRAQTLPLADFIKSDVPVFNPGLPDDPGSIHP